MLINAKHPFLQMSCELTQVCQPLELFYIYHFTYQKQFHDGSRIILSNKPQWIEDYYNLALYKTSLFEEKTSLYQSGFQVWFGDYDLEVYRHGKQYYNSAHSITITQPQEDGCEFYFFATSAENYAAINYLTNHPDILYHFIAYFKDKTAKLLNRVYNKRLLISDNNKNMDSVQLHLINQSFYHKMDALNKRFFQATRIRKYLYDDKVKLSEREIDCLFHLINNKTAKETGDIMNISHRTVESYLENVKLKLSCNTKVELITKLKTDKYFSKLR